MVKVRKPRGGYCKKYSAGLVSNSRPSKPSKKPSDKFIKLQYSIQIDNPNKLLIFKGLKAHKIKINHLRVNITIKPEQKEKTMAKVKEMLIKLGATGYFISIIE